MKGSVTSTVFEVATKAANSARILASWANLRLGQNGPKQLGAHVSAATANNHLLLFAWSFPPDVNAGVYRPASFAKHGVKAGWRVSVLCSPIQSMESAAGMELLNSLPAQVGIFRASEPPPTSYRLLPKVDGGFPGIVSAWQSALAACRNNPPTVVLASGPPFLTFISAYFVARHFRVPLVLDYRDEWSIHTPEFVSASGFDNKWEKRLLRSASAIVFVTEAARDVYLASVTDLDAAKCFVVPNGWDPDDFAREPVAKVSRSADEAEKFTISYVGTSSRYTDPSGFLSCFQEVIARRPFYRERLLLRFVGAKTPETQSALARFRAQFPNSIELVDRVTKSESVEVMRGAGAMLVLLDSYYDTMMPSKLYEYMAAEGPILVFGETGLPAGLVRRLGAGLVVPAGDSLSLEAAFDTVLREPRVLWNTPDRVAWLAGYTRSALTSHMLAILGDLHSPAGVPARP